MTKQELVEELCERTDLTRSAAFNAVDNLTAIIAEALTGGDDVILRGFGTFKRVTVKERKGRDIRQQKEIVIPARNVIKFYPSTNVKAKL